MPTLELTWLLISLLWQSLTSCDLRAAVPARGFQLIGSCERPVQVSRPNFLTLFVVQPLAREGDSEHPGRSGHLSQHESLLFLLQ
jgi:hypothetical protein